MPPLSVIFLGHLLASVVTAYLAGRRGRSPWVWLGVSLVATPPVALISLWFLADLESEGRRTREFLNQARQRRHRRDPHDTFSRTREQQEQQIQEKAVTVRLHRQWASEHAPVTRTLRARANRTPITAIMDAKALAAPTRRRVHS